MAKESRSTGDESASRRTQDKAIEAAVEAGGGAIWIREDGALCVGNECMVIKRRPDSRDLDIEIKPDRCGKAVAEQFADTIYKTIGRGGATHFKVQSELEGKEKEG